MLSRCPSLRDDLLTDRDTSNRSLPHAPPTRERPTLISVIIPVLNEQRYIAGQLEALATQAYEGAWEVVVADNGCTDGTLEVVRRWTDRLPALTIVDASNCRGLNHARNAGVSAARGDFLAFCDGDDVVAPGWLEAIAASACEADIVAGALFFDLLNDPVVHAWRPAEPLTELPIKHDFLAGVPGGNCGMWTSIARNLGWDPTFTFGGSDIEFSWRAQLAGCHLAFASDAIVHVRWRGGMWDTARQWFAYGESGGRLYRRFGVHGMARSDTRRALREWRWLLLNLADLARSCEQRGYWLRVAAHRAGRVAGSLRWRVVFL